MSDMCRMSFCLLVFCFGLLCVNSTFADEKVDAQLALTQAITIRNLGSIDQSIDILENLLINRCLGAVSCPSPLTSQLRKRTQLELAKAYQEKKQLKKAQRLFEDVMEGGGLPPQVEENVRKSLAEVTIKIQQQRKEKHHFFGSARLLFGRDSNATIGPEEDALRFTDTFENFENLTSNETNVEGDEEGADGSSQKAADNYAGISGHLSYRYSLDDFQREGNLLRPSWRAGVYYFDRNYENVNSSDFNATSFYAGPELYSPDNWRASVDFGVNHIELGGSTLANYFTVSPSITWFRDNTDWQLIGGYSQRNFNDKNDKGKEGSQLLLGGSTTHRFSKNWSYELNLNLTDFDANEHFRSYRAGELGAELEFNLNKDWKFFSDISYKLYDYMGQQPLFNKQRKRKQQQFELGTSYQLNSSLELGVNLSMVKNRESISPFNYNKNRVEGFLRFYF